MFPKLSAEIEKKKKKITPVNGRCWRSWGEKNQTTGNFLSVIYKKKKEKKI